MMWGNLGVGPHGVCRAPGPERTIAHKYGAYPVCVPHSLDALVYLFVLV